VKANNSRSRFRNSGCDLTVGGRLCFLIADAAELDQDEDTLLVASSGPPSIIGVARDGPGQLAIEHAWQAG